MIGWWDGIEELLRVHVDWCCCIEEPQMIRWWGGIEEPQG